jgi:hypothetical protein
MMLVFCAVQYNVSTAYIKALYTTFAPKLAQLIATAPSEMRVQAGFSRVLTDF